MNTHQKRTQTLAHSLGKPSVRWSIFLISVFSLFTVIGPNLEWLKSPLTQPVKLKVFDSDTNKPVSDMYVVFRWVSNHTYFPGQGTGKSSHVFIGRTDQNGEIKVGRKIKPLAFYLPPLFYREFAGIYLFSVDNRYKWTAQSIDIDGRSELRVKRILNADDLIENYNKYDSWTKYNESFEVTKLCAQYRDEAKKMTGK